MKCCNCVYWDEIPEDENYISIDARICKRSPWAVPQMKSNDFAIHCGHDGPIYCGPDFGCVNFEPKTKDSMGDKLIALQNYCIELGQLIAADNAIKHTIYINCEGETLAERIALLGKRIDKLKEEILWQTKN
jgi:hypothetical protein